MHNHKYFFDVLPIHPSPRTLESLTSYLIRLGEANAIRTIGELSHVVFPSFSYGFLVNLSDFPPRSFGALPTAALCSDKLLLATTFYHLTKKFDRAVLPKASRRFLSGSIGKCLRYCPVCIREKGYYSLIWRFIHLSGCVEHNTQLLQHCSFCQHPIPLFSNPLKIGVCPTCNQDLRNCPTETLSAEQRQFAINLQQDLEFLLIPQTFEELKISNSKTVGKQFALLRHKKKLTMIEIAQRLKISFSRISGIESGLSSNYGASLQDYFDYSHYLRVSIQEMFNKVYPIKINNTLNTPPPNLLIKTNSQLREEEILQKVVAVVNKFVKQSSLPTQAVLAREVQLSLSILKNHPKIRVVLDQYEKERKKHLLTKKKVRILELITQGDQNIELPEIRRESSTPRLLSKHSQLSNRTLNYNPETTIIISPLELKLPNPKKAQRETELVQAVQEIIDRTQRDGRVVYQKDLCETLQISLNTLKRYPKVKAILEGVEKRRQENQKQLFEKREAQLIIEIEKAIEELKAAKQKITKQAISNQAGLSATVFYYYPKIRAILEKL